MKVLSVYVLMPGGEILGKTLLEKADDLVQEPRSQLIVCPSCGEVWARVFRFRVNENGKKKLRWITRGILCTSCGDGSLLPLEEGVLAEHLPSTALIVERELRICNAHS